MYLHNVRLCTSIIIIIKLNRKRVDRAVDRVCYQFIIQIQEIHYGVNSWLRRRPRRRPLRPIWRVIVTITSTRWPHAADDVNSARAMAIVGRWKSYTLVELQSAIASGSVVNFNTLCI